MTDTERRPGVAPLEISYSDDPRVVSQAATEDYSTHVMPLTWRSGRLSLTMAWWAFISAIFYMVTAATIAQVVGPRDAVIGIVLSVVAYGAINYVFSRYANRTGLTVALLSRRMFGYLGAALAPLLLAATAIYLAVFEASVVAVALQAYVGVGAIEVWYLVVVLYSLPLVIGGVRRWLDKFNGVLLPFYLAGLVAAVVLAGLRYGVPDGWLTATPAVPAPVSAPGWAFAFFAYMGVWVAMMMTTDFARFGKPADARFHGIVTFGPVFYTVAFLVNGLVGIFLVAAAPGDGPVSEVSVVFAIVQLMGLLGVLFILVTQTRINTGNLYLASMNLEAFGNRVLKIKMRRVGWLVVVGVLTYLLMLTDVLTYLLTALAWQGVFVVAWVGIALTHILLNRGREDLPEFRPGRVAPFAPGVVAWFVASGLGILLYEAGGTVGATWSSPVTLVTSVLLYALASRLSWRVVLDRPGDPRDEVEDMWEARIRCHSCDRSYIAVEMDRDPSTPDHAPICADCGSASTAFLRAARAESEG